MSDDENVLVRILFFDFVEEGINAIGNVEIAFGALDPFEVGFPSRKEFLVLDALPFINSVIELQKSRIFLKRNVSPFENDVRGLHGPPYRGTKGKINWKILQMLPRLLGLLNSNFVQGDVHSSLNQALDVPIRLSVSAIIEWHTSIVYYW